MTYNYFPSEKVVAKNIPLERSWMNCLYDLSTGIQYRSATKKKERQFSLELSPLDFILEPYSFYQFPLNP